MFQEFLLLLPSLVCFFWAITLGVDWKRNWRAQNLWVLVLVVGMINSFYWTYMAVSDHGLLSKLAILVSYTHAGFYSLLYLFYKSLTGWRPFTWKDYAILILPLLMGTLFTLCSFILGTGHFEDMMNMKKRDEAIFASSGLAYTLQYLIGAYLNNLLAIALANVLLLVLILRKIRYRENPRLYFSLPEGYCLAHAGKIVWGVLTLLVFMFIFLVGEFLYFIERFIPFYVLFAAQGVIFYYISYQVYHLKSRRGGRS